MIYKITSSLPKFKTLTLHPGLNILLADQTEKSVQTDTRNGSGKSSLISLIHFLLGGDDDTDSVFRQDPLAGHWFAMRFNLGRRVVTVRRSGSRFRQVNVVTEATDELPEIEEDITNAAWQRRLGEEMFGIEPGEPPSFRSAFSYFARRQDKGGFQDATKHASQQRVGDVQLHLSLLLDLNTDLPVQWQKLRDREAQLKTLRSAARGGAFGEVVGNAGELASELAAAEAELAGIVESVDHFTVIPTYEVVAEEVTNYGRQIRALNDQIVSDREYAEHLSLAIENIPTFPVTDLNDLFAAARVQLPGVTLAAFDDVAAFHESVISNRRQYLAGEIERIDAQLHGATQERDELARRRSEGLQTLSSGGAIETLVELNRDVARRQAQVEQIRERHRTAQALESEQGQLRLERQQLALALNRDVNERQEYLNPAFVLFSSLSQRLYSKDQRGRLVIRATDNGPEVKPEIPRRRSKGITNMQVFCFDMTLAILAARRHRGPGVLVHDSHLFDGVDGRQIHRALLAGMAFSEQQGFQYLVTLNSDQFPTGDPMLDAAVLEQKLTDHDEDGGLFGLRFDV